MFPAYKKILVRAPNWVGDGVMATPMLTALRSNFPEAHITVLAKPTICALLTYHPAVDRLWVYEKQGRHAGIGGFFRLITELRRERFDAVFLLQNAIEAALIAFFSGIPERIGYDTEGRALLLTKSLPLPKAPRHQRDLFYQVGGVAYFSQSVVPEPSLILTEEEVATVSARLAEAGISSHDFIVGVCPGSAAGSAKRWLPDRFAAVSDHLIKSRGAKILILGGPHDRSVTEIVLNNMKKKGTVLAPELSLREMMAAISLCKICLVNDSGPMHIASALGIPYVALFGPGVPEISFPGGPGTFIRHPVRCSPCSFVVCPIDHRCMTRISVEAVLRAISELFSED